MTTAESYVESVLARLPRSTPLREQIAMELKGHIAERLGNGGPLEEILRQLGDPARLAESYLGAVPLVSAPLGRRVVAKLVDAGVVLGAAGSLSILADRVGLFGGRDVVFVVAFGVSALAFFAYTVWAGYRYGATVGKSLAGLRVVRESGASIGLGQAVVRQLPNLLSLSVIDVVFALFTEKKQRAFEVLSRSRVVVR
ncbi:MAG: RDD family protein [Holophagales bacterium]|nr:RDD family protein [Holophagales bacterium]